MAHIHKLYDFTVSFLILHPSEPKILLHFHKKLGFWNQLGGHIELDEHPLESLEREITEETGLQPGEYEIIQTAETLKSDVAVSLPVGFGLFVYDYGDTGHKHIDISYVIQSKKTEIHPAEGESTQIDWFDIEQITKMREDNILGDNVYNMCEWILAKKSEDKLKYLF